MASSNRHWPSMFKSKPCNSHHPWQHESYLLSTGCHRSPYSSASGCEERTPEPKPRWNPKPEQIRILEAIFNSGMVNPPRDEIRKIRAQLQEYGQVGDANVFYWFQNRKSRSKHKLRHLQNSSKTQQNNTEVPVPTSLPASSSSSSSEKSSLTSKKASTTVSMDVSSSATGSADQNVLLNPQPDFAAEPFTFPSVQHTEGMNAADGVIVFSDGSNNYLLNELMMTTKRAANDNHVEERNLMGNLQPQMGYTITPSITHTIGLTPPESNTPINAVPQGDDQAGAVLGSSTGTDSRSTVLFNDMFFDVPAGPFNVRLLFGDDVVLVQPSGQPLLTDEWGATMQPLQPGGVYYLLPLPSVDHHLRLPSGSPFL